MNKKLVAKIKSSMTKVIIKSYFDVIKKMFSDQFKDSFFISNGIIQKDNSIKHIIIFTNSITLENLKLGLKNIRESFNNSREYDYFKARLVNTEDKFIYILMIEDYNRKD